MLQIPPILSKLQELLVGDWENQDFGVDGQHKPVGGLENPLSYNLMPLPQASDPDGYILKNFRFTERLHFNDGDGAKTVAIAAVAANRGGSSNQNVRVIFYEQQVRFNDGPEGRIERPPHGDVVHVENGAWLFLPVFPQMNGPYGTPPKFNPLSLMVPPALEPQDGQQPLDMLIAKQINIPHGNSVLALGSYTLPFGANLFADPTIPGSPIIPNAPSPFPVPAPGSNSPPIDVTQRYKALKNNLADYQNPFPTLTLNPNLQLQKAVELINPDSYIHFYATAKPPAPGAQPDSSGIVTNIPFEDRLSRVTAYDTQCWMLFKGKDRFLCYSQTIMMTFTIKGHKYCFPHITANTVKWVGPTE